LGAVAETTNFAVLADPPNHTFPLPSIRQKGDETRALGFDRTVQGPASNACPPASNAEKVFVV